MGVDNDHDQETAAVELRRHAEKQWYTKTAGVRHPRAGEESQWLVHELEVHQIELEMQNAELRQARDEIESALEKYIDLYDFAPVGYCTLDRNGNIRSVNLNGASLLGIERSRLLGSNLGKFVTGESRPAFTAFLTTVCTSRAKETCEVALLGNDSSPVIVRIEAIASDSGEECRLALIDITGRRKMEEKLEILYSDLAARAAELETANIELEAFNHSVSHDLRRPLTAINSYCQAVQAICGNSLDEKCKSYIQEIYEGTLRMNRLIGTLLNFSSIKRAKIRREKFDLSKMAEEVALGLELSEPERGVLFRIAPGIEICGDPGLLRVVLDNLIGNAWKYTCNRDQAVIELGVTEVEEKTAWYIRDNGHGFAMAHAEKLFIPFQRLPGSEEFRGYGIGLATVERIIKRHGGKTWAVGEPDKGATFYFTLGADGLNKGHTS